MGTSEIIIVSGLPRSGTSMLMNMLRAGGLEILTDNQRKADADNPRGYYEFEGVKKLAKDKGWISGSMGRGLKVVSPLLKHLPASYSYKVLFMLRNMQEVLASQNQMLVRRGEQKSLSDEETLKLWENHLSEIRNWLQAQPNFDILYLMYHNIIRDAENCCSRINLFLGNRLNETSMVSGVDPSLYRQRVQRF